MVKKTLIKSKLSGIVDNSSLGLTIGSAEMEIGRNVAITLSTLMMKDKRFITEGDMKGLNGKATIWITTETPVIYQFKKQGKHIFLNVTGNPTVLMVGKNSVPVLLKDGEYDGNAILNTFCYANRIMFALLEHIPDFDFTWTGRERDMMVHGKFNISRLQYAWYSADLKNSRDDVLLFLRKCYNGQNATKNKASNLASDLGININAWDNHKGNLTFTLLSGGTKVFGITLYSKDQEKDPDLDNSVRLMSLIRFDGTFYDYFLKEHGIKTVSDLEDMYERVCDEGGYDIGFVKWLSSQVFSKLKLEYVTSLTLKDYLSRVEKVKLAVESKSSNETRLLNFWLNYNKIDGKEETFSVSEKCSKLGVNYKKYSLYVDNIMRNFNLDISISRSFHEAMLLNRIQAGWTEEERGKYLENQRNNEIPNFEELASIDSDNVSRMSGLLVSDGLTKIRKLKPTILKSNDFWAYRKLQENAKS